MRIFKYLFILFSFICLCTITTQAQSLYPVRVQPSCAFPSVFLDDYKSPENFRVLVSLTDVNEPQYEINLKVEFYSSDYSFKSINGINVTLVGGDIYTLNQNDLSRLLDAKDLTTITGITDAPSKIPPGLYTISFQAYDAINTNIPVSNGRTDFTVANVQMNEGPLLTMPVNQQEFDLQKGLQNIMFAWTPRTISFSPARPVKYQLKIVEVYPADRNPYDAIKTNQYLVNNQVFDDITSNAFNYDPSNFNLKDGAVYAWQVQAYEELITPNGIQKSSARFNNGGLSDVFTFSTTEICEPVYPDVPLIEYDPVKKQEQVILSWDKTAEHQYYEVSYKKELSTAPWTIIQQQENTLVLDETVLEKGAVYQYKVAPKCNKWHPAKEGETFQLEEKECTAPEPILVKTNNANGIVLEWEATENAVSYDVIYHTGSLEGIEPVNVKEPQITLPKINSGTYTVQVNGVCSENSKAEGKEQQLNYNETSIVGNCPLPKPFSIIATRFKSSAEKHMATINWPSLDIHESYDVSYWHKDSLATSLYQFTNSNPSSNRPKIFDGQLYKIQIIYTCVGGKTVTSPEVGFRINSGATELDLLPGTGDCFPPADLSAEVRSETSARIEWNKISGAEEYEVIFWLEAAEGETENHQEFMTTAGNSRLTNLESGKTYHYQIRCKCGGKFSIFSEEGTFDLSDVPDYSNCPPVEDLVVTGQTESSIQLTWPLDAINPPASLTGYRIRYKTAEMMWKDAYTENIASVSTLIDEKAIATNDSIEYTMESLEEGTTYQFEISATCGTDDKSEPISVEGATLLSEEPDCASGGMCDISSTTPISPEVQPGDTLGFADSKMVVVKVTNNGNGLYSGTGYTETPMVGFTEAVTMGVNFTNMFVNDKNCVTDGEFDTQVNLDILPPEISSKINAFVDQYEEYSTKIDQVLSETQGAIKGGQDALNEGMDYFQGGGSKGMPTTGGLGNAVEVPGSLSAGDIIVDNGVIQVGDVTIDEGLPALIKDADGKVFSVDKDGNVIEAGQYSEAAAGAADLPADEDIKVTFSENTSADYSYDAFREAYDKSMAMKTHYMYIDGKGIDAKAIIPGAADPVNFTIEGGSVDNLSFVNGDGFEYKFDKNNKKLTLVGGPAKDAQIIYALYEDNGEKKRVGALLVSSYAPKTKKVVLVTFNQDTDFSKDIDAIQQNLNKVYHTVGVHYEVEVDNSFRTSETWCLDGSACVFQVEPSAKLSNDYSGVEKDVVDAYIEHAGADALDPDAAYIFLTNVTVFNPNETLAGKMSFGKQFGFLYDVNLKSEAELGNTLAHELGHGNYKLQHVFDDIYLGEEAQGNTDNIMDYAHEDKLNKLQWDIIQEPGVTWGLFEKDEDQMAKGNKIAKYCKKINEIKVTNEFEAVSFNRNTFTEALKYASEKGIASYLPSYENIPSGLLKAYEPGNPNFNLQSVYASQTVLESFNKAGNEHVLFHYYVQRLFCEENSTSVAIKPLSFNTIKDDSDKNAKVEKFIEALESDNNTTADGSIQLNNAQVQVLSDAEVMGYVAKRLTTYSPMNIITQDGSKSYTDYSIVVPHTETNEFQVLVKNDENYQTYDFDLLDFHRDKSLTGLGQGVANNGKKNNYEDYEGCAILRILDTISEIHYGEGHHFYHISDGCKNIDKNFNNVNGVKVDMYVEQHQISENNEEMNVTLYLDEISDNDITVELQLPLTEKNPAKHAIHTDLTGPDDYTLKRQVTIPAGTRVKEVPLKTILDTYATEEGEEKEMEEETEYIQITFDNNNVTNATALNNSQNETIEIVEYYYPTFANISDIHTYIDAEGNVKITWHATGNDNVIRYSISGSAQNIVTSGLCLNNYCEFNVPTNSGDLIGVESKRELVIDYEIKSRDRSQEDYIRVRSETGNFQGEDVPPLCEYEKTVLGDPEEKSRASEKGYTYEWSQSKGESTEEFLNNKNEPSFEYHIVGDPDYILKRFHKQAVLVETQRDDDHYDNEVEIIDEAVVLVHTLFGCEWELLAKDFTLPEGSGDRIARNGETLEIVEIGTPQALTENGTDVEVLVNSSGTHENSYEYSFPNWRKEYNNSAINIDGIVSGVSYTRDELVNMHMPNNAIPGENDVDPNTYFYEVSALRDQTNSDLNSKIAQNVSIDIYQENKLSVNSFAAINDPLLNEYSGFATVCETVNNAEQAVNRKIHDLETVINDNLLVPLFDERSSFGTYELPIRCSAEGADKKGGVVYDVWKYNAEKWSDKIVVVDQTGTITAPFHADEEIDGYFFELKAEAHPITIVFDQRNRQGKNTEVDIDQSAPWKLTFVKTMGLGWGDLKNKSNSGSSSHKGKTKKEKEDEFRRKRDNEPDEQKKYNCTSWRQCIGVTLKGGRCDHCIKKPEGEEEHFEPEDYFCRQHKNQAPNFTDEESSDDSWLDVIMGEVNIIEVELRIPMEFTFQNCSENREPECKVEVNVNLGEIDLGLDAILIPENLTDQLKLNLYNGGAHITNFKLF